MRARLAQLKERVEESWLYRYAWDNPSAEHDARTILSAPKVGLWLGLEVLAIILATTAMLVIAPAEEAEFRDLLEIAGTGRVLINTTFLTMTLLVTLVVPFRAVGLLEGPRWRGYLDQVITTGLSPLRYFAGKVASSQPFFMALFAASFPFVSLFGLLGGADWTQVLAGYLLLYLYANLLLCVACALGSLLHEVLALLLTLFLAGLGHFLAVFPFPAVLATYSPARYLLIPGLETVAGTKAAQVQDLYATVSLLGLEIGWLPWTLAVWALLFLLCGLTCALGPLHAFVPGLNNFGSLVLPGDRNLFRLRKFRPFVTRRTELAFLFDNRSVGLGRWALPIRALQLFALLSLIAVQLFSSVFANPFVAELPHDIIIGGEVFSLVFCLVLTLILLTTGQAQSLTRFRLAGISIPQVAFDGAILIALLCLLVLLHVSGWAYAWAEISKPRSFWRSMGGARELFRSASLALATLIPLTITTFLMMKLVAARFFGKGWVLLAGVVFVGFCCAAPSVLVPIAEGFARSKVEGARAWAEPLYLLSLASPLTEASNLLDSPPRWLERDHWLLERAFWFWQALVIAYLGALVWRAHRSILQRAEVFATRDIEAEAAARGQLPCPSCGSQLQTETPSTPWGGILLTRFFKEVRCLECGCDFHGPSGETHPRRNFYIGVVRYGFLGVMLLFGVYLTSSLM